MEPTVVVLNIALVIAITAFLKAQFNFEGVTTRWVALGVFVVVWGVPWLGVIFPQADTVIKNFLAAFEIFLGSMGTADFVKQTAARITEPKG